MAAALLYVHHGKRNDVMHTVYIHPESALHFDGVYLLTLSLGALLYLSFAVFSSGFQQTTEGAGCRTGNVYESFQKKKKKAKTITPPRSVTPSESCRGQLGCHEEFVSAAPVFACREG